MLGAFLQNRTDIHCYSRTTYLLTVVSSFYVAIAAAKLLTIVEEILLFTLFKDALFFWFWLTLLENSFFYWIHLDERQKPWNVDPYICCFPAGLTSDPTSTLYSSRSWRKTSASPRWTLWCPASTSFLLRKKTTSSSTETPLTWSCSDTTKRWKGECSSSYTFALVVTSI